jgi:hypothetical protein
VTVTGVILNFSWEAAADVSHSGASRTDMDMGYSMWRKAYRSIPVDTTFFYDINTTRDHAADAPHNGVPTTDKVTSYVECSNAHTYTSATVTVPRMLRVSYPYRTSGFHYVFP